MIVRYSTEDDWKILKEIRLASLLDAPTAFGVSHASALANSDDDWRTRAGRRGKAEFLLAFVEGAAVGMVAHTVSDAGEFNLIAMWVKPEYRGAAIASALVDAAKAAAAAQGHTRVVLDVSPENGRAAAFYRRQGFAFLPEWEPLASHPHIQVQKMEWLAAT
jgi:ribosomal protein S18 acetylase RimI-like enzyme